MTHGVHVTPCCRTRNAQAECLQALREIGMDSETSWHGLVQWCVFANLCNCVIVYLCVCIFVFVFVCLCVFVFLCCCVCVFVYLCN